MKKTYSKLNLSPVAVKMETVLLVGSKTTKAIKVNTVTVDPYANGFESETGGFKEISFD